MAGLVPAIHALLDKWKAWMRGTSPRMTSDVSDMPWPAARQKCKKRE
jgi:hypothetical protein